MVSGWWLIGGRDSSWFLQSPHKFTGKPHPHWNPLYGGESSRWPGPCTPSTPKEMSQKGDVGMWGICCCSWFYVGVCVSILNYCHWKSRMVVAVAVVCHAGWWVQPVETNESVESGTGSSQDFDHVKMALESQPHQSPLRSVPSLFLLVDYTALRFSSDLYDLWIESSQSSHSRKLIQLLDQRVLLAAFLASQQQWRYR